MAMGCKLRHTLPCRYVPVVTLHVNVNSQAGIRAVSCQQTFELLEALRTRPRVDVTVQHYAATCEERPAFTIQLVYTVHLTQETIQLV